MLQMLGLGLSSADVLETGVLGALEGRGHGPHPMLTVLVWGRCGGFDPRCLRGKGVDRLLMGLVSCPLGEPRQAHLLPVSVPKAGCCSTGMSQRMQDKKHLAVFPADGNLLAPAPGAMGLLTALLEALPGSWGHALGGD